MVLAAGRGERMRPLTDRVPKPLLEVAGKALIERLIARLAEHGFDELVINTSWLGELLEERLGDGRKLGVSIAYSREPSEPLGTAGGILAALPLLGDEPFVVVNSDVWTDYPFAHLRGQPDELAHLVLIDNPAHQPGGDFALQANRVSNEGEAMFTFSGIAAYHPELFTPLEPGRSELAPLLRAAARNNLVSGEHFSGTWIDVGTPERLELASDELRQTERR